jgi:NADPH-dependent 2,4-dienoyl-CoA reductase/sulfur reductase-like enzyme
VNDRTDEFGGDLAARCRFTTDIVEGIRDRTGEEFCIGLRLSAEERSEDGLSFEETLPIVEQINETIELDYWSLVVGSSSTHRGCSYIVPPATEAETITQSPARVVDEMVDAPLMVTSRINTPEKAVRTLEDTGASVVGMTRALIADPELPAKTKAGRDDVVPCVACNQGCIGRYQEGLPIRCTVNPVTGREAAYGTLDTTAAPRHVLVVGGGPAGLVAATTAGKRGHDVTLVEQSDSLGGQVRAYADLEHRGRFDEWIETLAGELDAHDVDVRLDTTFEIAVIDRYEADTVILATGATGRVPDVPIDDEMSTYTAADALSRDDPYGESVLVSDWDGNEAALDVATVAADAGASVEIVTSGYSAGESVQQYIQNSLLGDLYEDDVTLTPHHRVGAVEDDAVVLENIFNDGEMRREGVDTVVFSHGGEAEYGHACDGIDVELHRVGDAWAPRSLDEAVWEAFETAADL